MGDVLIAVACGFIAGWILARLALGVGRAPELLSGRLPRPMNSATDPYRITENGKQFVLALHNGDADAYLWLGKRAGVIVDPSVPPWATDFARADAKMLYDKLASRFVSANG